MQENKHSHQQQHRRGWIDVLASKYLTLVVVVLLIALSLVGALVPQKGIVEENIIREWQLNHPHETQILSVAGFFSAFNSPIFLVALLVLFLNTLACTYRSVYRKKLFPGKSKQARLRRYGFVILHISILVCILGGFISAAFRMRGHLIVTEGQTVQDRHDVYPRLVEGPLRKERHDRFQLELVDAEFELATRSSMGRIAATVRLSDGDSQPIPADIEFNHPLSFNKTVFTLRDIGYAPQIQIRSLRNRFPPLDGFIALKVWGYNEERSHYDFISLPEAGRRLSITLYPSHEIRDGQVIKTSESLGNPILLVFQEYMNGTKTTTVTIQPGERATIGDLEIQFGELRQWAAFQVVHDPGYCTVCLSFWMAIIALGMRYYPDMRDWIQEVKQHGKD